MAIFDKDIIRIEGGLTHDPQDRGGLTKYGISQREYPDLDILRLTPEQAIVLYRKDYWDKLQLSTLDNQQVANLIFLLAVNIGIFEAITITQDAVNHCSTYLNVKIDGNCGVHTIDALNHSNTQWLIDAIRIREVQYYLSIVNRNPKQEVFFRGWINRVFEN
jgi:lysozyme family protein